MPDRLRITSQIDGNSMPSRQSSRPGQAELDGRARNAADVALVVGVALDHLELVAAAEDADRQHAGGVDQLARHVDRHVADRLAPGLGGLPFAATALKSRSSNSSVQRSTTTARHSCDRSVSPMLPLGWRLGDEGREALVGVVGLHQLVEIEALDFGQASAHVARRSARAPP